MAAAWVGPPTMEGVVVSRVSMRTARSISYGPSSTYPVCRPEGRGLAGCALGLWQVRFFSINNQILFRLSLPYFS